MIRVVVAQLRARWVQALTLLLLSMAVTTAAVCAPVFAAAVDRASLATELEAASGSELVASVPLHIRTWPDTDGPSGSLAVAALPGFIPVTTIGIEVDGLLEGGPRSDLNRLVSQEGFCPYAVFLTGRCPVGSREIALPAALAEETDRAAGDQVTLQPMVRVMTGVEPAGPPVDFTVVGVFEARDPTDPYWAAGFDPIGLHGYPAIFTNQTALAAMTHGSELVLVDAVLPRDGLSADQIPHLRTRLAVADQRVQAGGFGEGLVSGLPALLDRVSREGEQARTLLPITAAPLVALGWLVVYVAVAHSVSARRQEAAVVALRGATRWTRTAVVGMEQLLPVAAGVPVGVVAAYLLATLVGPAGVPLALTAEAVVAAALAAAGTVVAVLVGLRRELAAPVAQLLRRVPRRRRVAVATGELLVVALALVVVADVRLFDRDLGGLMAVAPAVVMVAVVVLAARVVAWVADAAGRRGLRRGRLAPALAALQLSRRPGAVRLVLPLGLALGMLGFAVTSIDVAEQGRAAQVQRDLGAPRVLEVPRVDGGRLLSAVREVDPAGRYAMAVVRMPADRNNPQRLAVDATRLAAVAVWPEAAGTSALEQVAEVLRPATSVEPAVVGDGRLTADLTLDLVAEDGSVLVSAWLTPVTGGRQVVAEFGPLQPGRHEYAAYVTGCPDGCRLAALHLGGESDRNRVDLAVHDLRGDVRFPDGGQLADPGRWLAARYSSEDVGLVAEGGRLEAGVRVRDGIVDALLLPQDAPEPLPVASTGLQLPAEYLTNLDSSLTLVTEAVSARALPGLAGAGVLTDLEYAVRSMPGAAVPRDGEVWLAADAPSGIADQLREAGLAIGEERTATELLARADASGGALGLRFFQLAAGIAMAVGLLALAIVVVVDRRSWSSGLRQLRAQGVAERTVAWAGIWSYGGVVLAAVVAGAAAAGASWLATGDRLPLGVDPLVVPAWPHWLPVVLPWTVVVAVLLAAAVAGGWWQHGAMRMAQQEQREVRG